VAADDGRSSHSHSRAAIGPRANRASPRPSVFLPVHAGLQYTLRLSPLAAHSGVRSGRGGARWPGRPQSRRRAVGAAPARRRRTGAWRWWGGLRSRCAPGLPGSSSATPPLRTGFSSRGEDSRTSTLSVQMSNSRTSGRQPGLPKQRAVGVNTSDTMKWAIEQDAARVAALELQRRRALLALLGSAQWEAITRIAHRVAEHIADCLVTDAQSDQAPLSRSPHDLPAKHPERQRPEPSHHDKACSP
jgi:hypothetical protein